MQLNFPRVFPESKTKFTCFINLSWSKDFPPVDTNMEIHKNWREHWNTEIQKYRKEKILEYRNTHVQLIGGLCALIGVFILALPVPIVVNRSHLNETKNASFINDHKKNAHQSWPIKTISRALFSGCDSRGHEIELTWGKFHYLESWTKAKIGTLMVSRYLICAPNSRLFQITQNEFYSCMLPSNWIQKKLFASLLNCRGKCRFI